MPIYEYRCAACGHQQEFLQKVSDAPHRVCPRCKAESFSKMLTAAGFQLKGSGWYATDFKGKGAAPAKEGPKEGAREPGKEGGGDKAASPAAASHACGGACSCG